MSIGFLLAALLTSADLTGGNLNGKLISIEGRAIGLTESGIAVKVDEIPITVITEKHSPYLYACSVTQPKLRVTGFLEQVYGLTASGENEGVVGLRLRPRSAADVSFVPDLRYCFNPFTLAVLLLLLLVCLFVVSRRQLRASTLMTERKRMADDLHDTIEQHLVGAGMLMQLGKTAEAREILVRAKKELRDVVWGLMNDDMMRLTPAEMIRAYAKEETKKGVCRIETRLAGLPEKLDASRMRDLSLVLREAIGNAVKHGHAQRAAIVSDPLANGGWRLRISNNGTPIDLNAIPGPDEGHFGLEGMKARARRLGAEFSVTADAGRTVVSLTCPTA